jgi:hypothetical protein
MKFEQSELVTIKKYLDKVQAELDRALLESCGIKSFVTSSHEAGVLPHLSHVVDIRLMVDISLAKEAEALLNSQNQYVANPSETPSLTADDELNPLRKPMRYAFLALAFGSIILPVLSNIYSLYWCFFLIKRRHEMSAQWLLGCVAMTLANIVIIVVITQLWIKALL